MYCLVMGASSTLRDFWRLRIPLQDGHSLADQSPHCARAAAINPTPLSRPAAVAARTPYRTWAQTLAPFTPALGLAVSYETRLTGSGKARLTGSCELRMAGFDCCALG